MTNEKSELGKGRTLGYIFYEPSTRTRMSFEAAMASLGGSSIGIFDPKSSSIEKGESLADTIRTMDLYSDVTVLRHPLDGSSRFAGELSKNPIINAGSGSEEHPTQAMLDLYTIIKEKKKIDGLAISIVGDLKYGRTVYSLLYGLANEKVKGTYTINSETLAKSKSDVSIMHPMPRMEEISHSIDNTKNAIYFKQAAYGKELRAALLTLILNESIV